MTSAGHHSMMGGGKWKNPYDTDGLVAMWDGEWSPSGSKLLNLGSGGNTYDATITSGGVVNNGFKGVATAIKPLSSTMSVHVVFSIGSNATGVALNALDNNCGYMLFQPLGGQVRWRWAVARDGAGALWQTSLISTAPDVIQSTTMVIASGDDKRIYIGDVLAQTSGGQTGFVDSSGTMTIGGGDQVMTVYNIGWYDRVLTADEIAANYAIDAQRFGLT